MYSIFGILSVLALFSLPNVEGHCVMRGECETDDVTFLSKPCVYRGEPLPLDDESAIKFLKDTCPTLKTGPNFELCCDTAQVKSFQETLSVLASLFKRCPSCFHNLANVFCQMTCSSFQSSFLQVTSYTTKGRNSSVNEISYYITEKFAKGLFDSCKNVHLGFTGGKAIGVTCGAHLTDCTPHLWLKYMGGHDPSPYQINFKFEQESAVIVRNQVIQPMDEDVIPCSKPVSSDTLACYYDDCPFP